MVTGVCHGFFTPQPPRTPEEGRREGVPPPDSDDGGESRIPHEGRAIRSGATDSPGRRGMGATASRS